MAGYTCTSVSPQCPVEATTYGYAPNLGASIFFLVVFGICTLLQFFFAIKHRLPAFGFAVTVGCFGETVGYGGRIIMHYNAWSQTGFKIQIVCLILSPSFLAAGIYLTLKHLVRHFGAQYSRLRPNLYTWIFISCDAASILVQAAGGGIASGETLSLVNIGDDIMVAGICVQVATMAVCGIVAIDFSIRAMKDRGQARQIKSNSKAFKFYVASTSLAFLTIFIRSIYRIPEMAGGWGNPLMQNEKEFLVLDGMMCAIAAIALTVAHPGIFFPEMRPKNNKVTDDEEKERDALGSPNSAS